MYHTEKKCRNCVLNGDCLTEDPEECDWGDEDKEDKE